MTKIYTTIRRPNGTTEELDVTAKMNAAGYLRMTDALFAASKAATRKAGKGELVSYRHEVIDDRTEAQKELDRIETLRDKAENVKDANYDLYLRRTKDADAAFRAWQASYPEAYAEIVAQEEEEAERRRQQHAESFVARNLD